MLDVRRLLAVTGIKESTGPYSIVSTRMIALGALAASLTTTLFGGARLARELYRPEHPGAFPARA